MKFREFGWHGILFEVPEDMRFVREGGDATSGHLRLESENFFFEAKWESFSPQKAKPLSEIATDLVKHIEKTTKQTVKILRKGSARVYEHDAYYMNIKSNVEESVYLWYCDESQRLLIFRFVFNIIDAEGKRIIKQVVDSLRCHSEKLSTWSALNFRFEIPKSMLLTSRKIAVGRTFMLFNERSLRPFEEKSNEIFIEYFSMANLILEDTDGDVGAWFQSKYLKDLKKQYRNVKFQKKKSSKFKEHDIDIRQGMSMSGLTRRKTSLYTNTTWYCPESNRIYSITFTSQVSRPFLLKRKIDIESHKSLMEEFLASFKCH